MKTRSFTIHPLPKIDFSISHLELDKDSPLNQHESHIHKQCEIYLNLSGDVSFEVENRIYPISRGSVIITRPMEYHHCIYHSDAPHEHYWITFSADAGEEFLKPFFDRKVGKDNLILLEEAQLEECLCTLADLLENENDSLLHRIAFCRLLRILDTGRRAEGLLLFDKLPQDVTMALRFMDEHLTEDLEIGVLAEYCNVSVNTLERHFKKSLGSTPFPVLRKKRLVYSMQFLRNGETVTDAAVKSGFSDYSNYVQLFRKQFDITPLQFKKKFEIK